jgi:hypothetical protein
MPVKSDKASASKTTKKPVVKRNTKKEEVEEVEKVENSASEAESENRSDSEKEEVKEAVQALATKKVTKNVKVTKKAEKVSEKVVVRDWDEQTDEGFDGAEPVHTPVHMGVSDDEDDVIISTPPTKFAGKKPYEQKPVKNREPREQKGDSREQQKESSEKRGARYGGFGNSPSLNFDYKFYLNQTAPVNEISTNDLLKIIIARANEDKQFHFGKNVKVILRARNSECEFPVTSTAYPEQSEQQSSFGNSGGYKGKKTGFVDRGVSRK